MGFMGLNDWRDSDNAADFHYEITDFLNKKITQAIKDNANQYNTPGFVNVLLFLKENPSLGIFVSKKNRDAIDWLIERDLIVGGYLKIKGGAALIKNWRTIKFRDVEE